MRIRRRPQAQALIPSPLQQPSDPPTASQPPPPGNQQHWLLREDDDAEKRKSEELHRPNVDLQDEPFRPALPSHLQGDNENVPDGAQCQGAATADGHAHGSPENGDRERCDQWALINAREEHLADEVLEAMPLALMSPLSVKKGIKTDSPKRRRGPAVLREGSRCSRVNGRGWRCSQPTLVGYSLCEHHLGKGRQSRANSGSGGRSAGVPKLGRTEPSGKKSVALLALAAAAADGNQPAAHLGA